MYMLNISNVSRFFFKIAIFVHNLQCTDKIVSIFYE